MQKSPKRPLVCSLAYDGLCLFEFGIAAELFGLPRPEYDHWYDFRVIAAERGKLRAMGGITMEADHDLEALETASLIIVPGWPDDGKTIAPTLKAALLNAWNNGARFASICSGVFLLAGCGFLDGRQATTHWRYAGKLQEAYPQINVDPNVLYVDEGQVLTSAGSAAGLDLCLHIVRGDYGAEVANQVARRLVVPAHRAGGQAQYIPRPMPKTRGGDIAKLMDAARNALDEDWPVTRMAEAAGLSPRTLLRRFRAETGESPQGWLTAERISRAKELLETTKLGVGPIAEACGLTTPETLRHHFRRLVGKSPLQYRAEFAV